MTRQKLASIPRVCQLADAYADWRGINASSTANDLGWMIRVQEAVLTERLYGDPRLSFAQDRCKHFFVVIKLHTLACPTFACIQGTPIVQEYTVDTCVKHHAHDRGKVHGTASPFLFPLLEAYAHENSGQLESHHEHLFTSCGMCRNTLLIEQQLCYLYFPVALEIPNLFKRRYVVYIESHEEA
ncbi:hypothetical protein KCU85_g363, partial [Aureobasidium melanogenum]